MANRTLGFLRHKLYQCPQGVKEAAYKGRSPGFGTWQLCLGSPACGSSRKIKKVQNRAARFATGNYWFETVSITRILEKLRWEILRKRRRDSRFIVLFQQHSN